MQSILTCFSGLRFCTKMLLKNADACHEFGDGRMAMKRCVSRKSDNTDILGFVRDRSSDIILARLLWSFLYSRWHEMDPS